MLYTCRRHEWVEPCCTDETAECLSCSTGKSISEVCAEHPYFVGCPQAAPVHEVCEPPTAGFDLPHKGCPKENDRSTCVANNANFHTLREAWDACSRTAECGVIMKFTDGYFYLRRRSDPDRELAGSRSIFYTCKRHEIVKEVTTVELGDPVHEVCPPPTYGFQLPNKGCPRDNDKSSCVANNAHYHTLGEAWKACSRISECGVVLKYIDGYFYLRRKSDPDREMAGSNSMLYTCQPIEKVEEVAAIELGEPVHEVCLPPTTGFHLTHKGCPDEHDKSSCLANDAHYRTLGEAWKACSRLEECGFVMKFTDDYFYLRRQSDPDREVPGSHSMLYECPPVKEVCAVPTSGFNLPHKGCPTEDDKSSCVANDAHYHTLSEAWDACSRNSECGLVMKFTDGNFYLRRESDPDREIAGSSSMLYTCEQHKRIEIVHSVDLGGPVHEVCDPPTSGFDLPHKGCPKENDETSCVANDAHYRTLAEAWDACSRIAECGIVMKYTNGFFYLRRTSDPDREIAGATSMLYTCRREALAVSPCCTDETIECTACSYDKTVAELCAEHPDTAGCPEEAAPPAPTCCTDETAECIACSYDKTVAELCAEHPDTAGCPQ